MMDVQLVVAGGSKAGQVIPIAGPKFIIGRAEDCHLKPRSELISRYHCAVISEDGYVAVRDLGSKNGIYVNGERVSMEQELQNGDKLNIGPLEFYIHLTVDVKGQKKSKVESISDAVSRTVEIQEGTKKPDEKESEITDWLLSSDESTSNDETRTINPDELAELMKNNAEKQEEESAPSETTSGSGVFRKPEAATSRDAAANLLKNFFKGGR